MTDDTLKHSSGHRFVPNGVGDYDLICPTVGNVPGFVPYMIARVARAKSICNGCGQQIGERLEPSQ